MGAFLRPLVGTTDGDLTVALLSLSILALTTAVGLDIKAPRPFLCPPLPFDGVAILFTFF
jgi:hypothetical protein